jgi:cell division protein FtsI (penicillin-binding protein 3)
VRVKDGFFYATNSGNRERVSKKPKKRRSGKDPILKYRSSMLLVIFLLIFLALIGRLIQVQAINYQKYAAYGEAELTHKIELPGMRGTIYDRNGNILAISIPAPTIVADPYQITDPTKEAEVLSPVVGIGVSQLISLLSMKAGFVYIAREISQSLAQKIMSLHLLGISEIQESKRVYPDPEITASFLGNVNADQTGISGLELQLNSLLKGKSGLAIVDKSPTGADLPGGYKVVIPSHQGQSIVLSIDSSLQWEVEQLLANDVLSTNAKDAFATIEDPKTGAILAMASVVVVSKAPENKNLIIAQSGNKYVVPDTVNLPVIDVFEPGSVMKVATMAGALTFNLVNPQSVLNIPSQLMVGGWAFHDAESHGDIQMSVTQILAQSSNIGTIEIAQMLGAQRLYEFLRKFGFGKPTSLAFPGESPGLLPPPALWSGSTIGSMPIGQAEGVTQLQIVNAYSVIADSGIMMPLHLIDGIVQPDGSIKKVAWGPGTRVISKSVDSELINMFEQVVKNGTGVEAVVPGYVVAGKTGTAQIPKNGGYIPGAFMATFVGFLPAGNAALVGAVTVDRPNNFYGGSAAAPVFSQIMQYAVTHFQIAPGD